jgi:Uma2 family endonuclease
MPDERTTDEIALAIPLVCSAGPSYGDGTMGTEQATGYTYEDWLQTPEGALYELIDGELLEMSNPSILHQVVVSKLTRLLLWSAAGRAEEFTLLPAPTGVRLSEHRLLIPDIVVVARPINEIPLTQNLDFAPELVVEVLSPSSLRHDRVRKRALYGEHGVAEYWVIDPASEAVEVYLRDPAGSALLVEGGRFGRDEVVRSTAFPGLDVEVAALFPAGSASSSS